MGFDVDAFCADGRSDISLKDTIKTAFADAELWLIANAGGSDGFISLGSLDCGQSIRFLEQALGLRFDPAEAKIWPPEEVRHLSVSASWPDPAAVATDSLWAYWSARKFLEVCVTHGLGIWTS